jgi:ferredoxin-NADP reductase
VAQLVKLKSRKEIATGTMEFHFKKPAGFTFTPGQAGDFTLSGPPDMVNAMQKMLADADVKSSNIRAEEFSGY